MLCGDLVKASVFVCTERDSVVRCAEIMRDRNVGFLPVVDREQKVLGIVTDRDLVLRVLAAGKPADTPVGSVMSREVVACHPRDDLRSAEARMTESRKSRLLVVDDKGRAVGVISLSDIAQAETRAQTGRVLQAVTRREARPHR